MMMKTGIPVLLTFFAALTGSHAATLTARVIRAAGGFEGGNGYNRTLFYDSSKGSQLNCQPMAMVNGGVNEILFDLDFPVSASNGSLSVIFSSRQISVPLSPGSYTDAQRAPFAAPGHSGLDYGFNGAGTNTLTGSFNILELTLGPNSTVLTFEGNFLFYPDGDSVPTRGSIRYDLNPVPETGTGLLLALAGSAAAGRRVRRGPRPDCRRPV